MIKSNTGILLTQIGTPSEPTPRAVKLYLKKFLTDPRVVEIPRLLWLPLLYGIILPLRSKKSAKLYQSIWTKEGSPLLVYSQKIAEKLAEKMQLPVALGMHYSSPSIDDALNKLKSNHVSRILVLPLYPQYSGTTTAASFDSITAVFKQWRVIPDMQTIHGYATHSDYINAIVQSIRMTWEMRGSARHLLFSYHGIPKRCITLGDCYEEQCRQTTLAIVDALQLTPKDWSLSFQSRIGRAQWLSPYTPDVLKALPANNVFDIDVICPGFATDCLETLEEINIRGKHQFLQAGGHHFNYIPALNDSDQHIEMLGKIVLSYLP